MQEVPVPLAHSSHPRRHNQADPSRRPHCAGAQANQVRRPALRGSAGVVAGADRPDRGGVGDTGRNPIVNDNHVATPQPASEGDHRGRPRHGGTAPRWRGRQSTRSMPPSMSSTAKRLGVEDAGAILGDRADPVLGVVRSAELAHSEDLERGPRARSRSRWPPERRRAAGRPRSGATPANGSNCTASWPPPRPALAAPVWRRGSARGYSSLLPGTSSASDLLSDNTAPQLIGAKTPGLGVRFFPECRLAASRHRFGRAGRGRRTGPSHRRRRPGSRAGRCPRLERSTE